MFLLFEHTCRPIPNTWTCRSVQYLYHVLIEFQGSVLAEYAAVDNISQVSITWQAPDV